MPARQFSGWRVPRQVGGPKDFAGVISNKVVDNIGAADNPRRRRAGGSWANSLCRPVSVEAVLRRNVR